MTENGRWNIRHLYLYLVCFATLMMLIVGSVQLIMSISNIVFSEPLYQDLSSLKFQMKQSNPDLTREEVERQAKMDLQRQELSQKHMRTRQVVNSVALIIVSLPIFIYHWRKIKHGENPV